MFSFNATKPKGFEKLVWSSSCYSTFQKHCLLIFGPKMEEIQGEWRKLQNEGLNDLYCSPNILCVIKSRRMRWAGHVACMGERRGVYTGFWWGNLRDRDHLGDPGIDGSITLRWIFRK